MLRYYRFILLRSRNLVPLEHHIVERLNIQGFRSASSNTSVKHDSKSGQSIPAQNRSEKPNVVEESESEKLINNLTNRGHFYGVRTRGLAPAPVSTEIAVSKLQTSLGFNQRITAESFVKAVLIPLQEKNPEILKMIKLDPFLYIPFFIRCCGLVMSDISQDQKLVILEHLLQAFKHNNMKMDIHAYIALLKVWMENEHEYDVDAILEEAEIDLKLETNVEFYNKLLWRLAETKDVKQMEKLLSRMTSQGILPNLQTELSQIFAASATNSDEKAELLVNKVLKKYGKDQLPHCLSAKIRGTLLHAKLDKFRKQLRSAVIDVDKEKEFSKTGAYFPSRYILNITYNALFDIIWRLAKRSRGGDGQEFVALTEQILDSAQRTTGFFKRLIREADRHIAHKYYYSAAALIGDTARVKLILDSQRKDTFIRHLMPRLANHMIRNRTSNEIIKDVANRLIVTFGPELRFYDDLAYSILTYKGYSYDEKFEMFSEFVDAFDSERSRPHILLPLLVQCPDLQTRHILLFKSSEIGYSDVTIVAPFIMAKYVYRPMLENYFGKKGGDDVEKLTLMSKVLESFNVKPEHTWKSLYEYAQLVTNGKHSYILPIDMKNFKKWLSDEFEIMFKDKAAEAEKKKSKYTYAIFQQLLKNHDVEKIHSFLVQRGGFPPEINYDEDIDTLIKMYLRQANFGYIKKLLHLM
uniref:Uncharacterized protein n=1 Tax=Panagrolaimus davidi TaxID=227884 RepID=A0A914PLA7_9BILA